MLRKFMQKKKPELSNLAGSSSIFESRGFLDGASSGKLISQRKGHQDEDNAEPFTYSSPISNTTALPCNCSSCQHLRLWPNVDCYERAIAMSSQFEITNGPSVKKRRWLREPEFPWKLEFGWNILDTPGRFIVRKRLLRQQVSADIIILEEAAIFPVEIFSMELIEKQKTIILDWLDMNMLKGLPSVDGGLMDKDLYDFCIKERQISPRLLEDWSEKYMRFVAWKTIEDLGRWEASLLKPFSKFLNVPAKPKRKFLFDKEVWEPFFYRICAPLLGKRAMFRIKNPDDEINYYDELFEIKPFSRKYNVEEVD